MKAVHQRISEFPDMCRKAGLKATHQRMEIYRVLAETDKHPDAERIYTVVRESLPSISLDTVYRTLRTLEEKGIVILVDSLGDRARFDANLERHHHFVCRLCGAVQDIFSTDLDDIRAPATANDMGKIESVRVELRGVCLSCRRKKAGNR